MAGESISAVARRTGFSPATLRYYERLELVHPRRAGSGYRRYGQDEVRLLEFIARAKRLGLSLEQIRSLVDARRADDCRATRGQLAELVEQRLADVQGFIADMTAFRDQLASVRADLTDGSASVRCGPGCGCQVEVGAVDLDVPRKLALLSVNRAAPATAAAPSESP